MPAKSEKQRRTMEAIKHGWRPKKGPLRKITPGTAKKILGEHKKP